MAILQYLQYFGKLFHKILLQYVPKPYASPNRTNAPVEWFGAGSKVWGGGGVGVGIIRQSYFLLQELEYDRIRHPNTTE